MKVSVIVPAYNEERRIASCLKVLTAYLERVGLDYEIVVSEDGSTDRTCEIVGEYARLNPRIRLLHSDRRLGKGGGILRGIEEAEGEAIVMVDVDLSAPPSQIPRLLEALKEADLALGSRNLPESRIGVKPPLHRRILNRAFNLLFRLLFKAEIHDTQCGFKAGWRRILLNLKDDITVKGFAFDVELIVEALRKGYRVVEVPITWNYQPGSKVNTVKQVFHMGRDLLKIWWKTRARKSL